MLFNSYIFILLFLPLCVLVYFILNHFHLYMVGQVFLIGMSLWFYGYFNVSYLAIIIVSVVANYIIYLLMERLQGQKVRKLILGLGLCVNLGLLGYFKYMDFFIQNINMIFHRDIEMLGIVLPLGLSFFTFQQISFIVDAYRGEVPKYNFVYYASFVTFFPQLIAGPIVTHDELVPQFMDESRKRIDWDNMAKGAYIFILGLSKKVLLADVFGIAVNWGYENILYLDSTNAFLIMLFYTFQIYFDFSGYCDMAIGIGKLLNVDLPLNFNSPYKALTITEFWDRWHMTLTRFFTKYVYIPLGGNRKGKVRTYVNIMIVFLASGFWHGAGWSFIVWGGCHGIFCVITRHFKKFFDKLHPVMNWMITFGFVNAMWVFFRADSLSQGVQLLSKIAYCNFQQVSGGLVNCFLTDEVWYVALRSSIALFSPTFIMTMYILIALFLILGVRNAHEKMLAFKPTFFRMLISAILLTWCIFSFSGVSTFLYFNF